MGEDPRQVGETVDGETRTPEEIEADIERTRREMGDTVAAVAEKTDVKAQAKSKVEETKARLIEKKDEVVHKTRDAAPGSSADGADKVARVAKENRRALVIGGAVLVAFLLGRSSRRE
jgi:Protein of unknown function (DUF3618)